MLCTKVFRALAIAGVVLACSAVSRAQCSADINQAFAANHSTPSASECDRTRYGGGTWAGQGDLVVRVAKARLCADPWVGQIYWNLYNRNPTAAECSANYGPRSSYMTLTSAVQAYKAGGTATGVVASAAVMQAIGQADGSLKLANGTTVCPGGCLVASGGGNLTAVTPGMVVGLVASGGGNFSLQSVGGHPHIAGTVIRK